LKKLVVYFILLLILVFSSPHSGNAQELYQKVYPDFGIGASVGFSYFFPGDLNDYIDLTVPGALNGAKKEHINTGINVGLFLMYNPLPFLEIVPEFDYFYSRRAFSQIDLDAVASYIQLGATCYYIRELYPGINLRFGAGISDYIGTVSWEYPYSDSQKWEGSSIGFHGAVGGEMILSEEMTLSLILVSRYANIGELKDRDNNIIRFPGKNKNLNMNFSGIEAKVKLGYYF